MYSDRSAAAGGYSALLASAATAERRARARGRDRAHVGEARRRARRDAGRRSVVEQRLQRVTRMWFGWAQAEQMRWVEEGFWGGLVAEDDTFTGGDGVWARTGERARFGAGGGDGVGCRFEARRRAMSILTSGLGGRNVGERWGGERIG